MPSEAFSGTPVVVKRHKRLHIAIQETGQIIYTPPDFIRLPSRESLQTLADDLLVVGCRDIRAIARFEIAYTRRVTK